MTMEQQLKNQANSSRLEKFYAALLAHPVVVFLALLLCVGVLAYFIKDFQIEASADTLVNENSADIQYSREIYDRYNIQDFLVITYSPKGDLLSDGVLADIAALQDDLLQLDQVESVMTLLDVPLLESPPIPLKELSSGDLPTLRSPRVDRNLARKELATSPLYKNLLVSPGLKTTGIQVNLVIDKHYRDAIAERDALGRKAAKTGLTPEETTTYQKLEDKINLMRKVQDKEDHQLITNVRRLMAQHNKNAKLFLGGVSMIANDMIRFIKNDLKVFGLGVFCFLIIMLGAMFRRVRWILLPMLCCLMATVSMMGLLGLFGWKVTVISSNFISLQLIITMALTIHLIVRFRELHREHPTADQKWLIIETVRLKLTPCIYAALTTIAGFASLLLSDIKPVITFGWMMVGGIIASLLITFLFFPVALALFPKTAPGPTGGGSGGYLTRILGDFTRRHGSLIIIVSLLGLLVSALGISRLTVENSFVNYFKKSTEIYQGMKFIDQHLGGTTPLDVIIDFNTPKAAEAKVESSPKPPSGDEFDMFDEFEGKNTSDQYWFTPYKMDRIMEIHDYLASLPETGKVMSLGTLLKVAQQLNNGKALDSVELPLVYNELPERFRDQLVTPFVSVEHNQARFSVRIIDTLDSLRRNKLVHQIKADIVSRFNYDPDQVHLTGILILYNNMLQSLFNSQILTLGVVLLALMLMFLVLFRSLRVAIIAIFPNLLSIMVVLGAIGWMGLPLDMMTITIASISVGIAVDDTIHYIHRFKHEFELVPDYYRAMRQSHDTIGYAMYYTSITIIVGFSILGLSNFIPTILFGLLTGLAMLIALLAALTLLPQLLVWIKPFGPEAPMENPAEA